MWFFLKKGKQFSNFRQASKYKASIHFKNQHTLKESAINLLSNGTKIRVSMFSSCKNDLFDDF